MATIPLKAENNVKADKNTPVVIIMLGAPGSGKGTQAVQISKKLGVPHISTGDLLRDNIRNGTELGKQAKAYMDKGQLSPDELILDILFDRIAKPDCASGYILDGVPRTTSQAHELEDTLRGKVRFVVVNLKAADDVVVKRLSGRLTCKQCNRIYQKDTNPPKQPGICDVCGGELYQRPDDAESVIKERLRVYQQQTKPLEDFYRNQKILLEVDASGKPEDVLAEALKQIEAAQKN